MALPELEGEAEIRQVVYSAERRFMALGSFYKYLQPTESELRDVEKDLRSARMYEILYLSRSMRRAELDAQRAGLIAAEKEEREEGKKVAAASIKLRLQALNVLRREMEAVRMEEEMRLQEDRRVLLQREKDVVMARRRSLEQSLTAQDPAGNSKGSIAGTGPPLLVMNVALHGGREEQIVMRKGDDPKGTAMNFVRRHHLPEHTAVTLANQLRANMVQQAHATQTLGQGGSSHKRTPRRQHSPSSSTRKRSPARTGIAPPGLSSPRPGGAR